MQADAWARVVQGLPLPSTVTRSSPSSSFSSPGMKLSAYCRLGVPTTGVRVIALVPPANAGAGRAVVWLAHPGDSRRTRSKGIAAPAKRTALQRLIGSVEVWDRRFMGRSPLLEVS